MNSDYINATLEQPAIDKVMGDIGDIRTNLPFLIDLSVEERRGMVKFGDKSRGFISKAAMLIDQHPEILPASVDLAGFRQDVRLMEALNPVRLAMEQLFGQIEDTVYAAGSDAYSGALQIYSYAKAANLYTSALEDAVSELGHRFIRRPRAAAAPAAVVPNEETAA